MNTPLLQVRVKPEVLREMKVIAVEKETTLTNIVRESVLGYIAKNKHLSLTHAHVMYGLEYGHKTSQ
jgi:hypothetical protein